MNNLTQCGFQSRFYMFFSLFKSIWNKWAPFWGWFCCQCHNMANLVRGWWYITKLWAFWYQPRKFSWKHIFETPFSVPWPFHEALGIVVSDINTSENCIYETLQALWPLNHFNNLGKRTTQGSFLWSFIKFSHSV